MKIKVIDFDGNYKIIEGVQVAITISDKDEPFVFTQQPTKDGQAVFQLTRSDKNFSDFVNSYGVKLRSEEPITVKQI